MPPRFEKSVGLACGLWLIWVSGAPGQEFVDNERWSRDYNGFALICRSLGLEPTTDIASWSRRDPRQTVLVVLGSQRRGSDSRMDVVSYLNRGGAVLFASELGDTPLFARVALIRNRNSLRVRDSANAFQGYPDCPLVRTFSEPHPVVDGLSSLATNRPAAIRLFDDNWQGIATFPPLQGRDARTYHLLAAPRDESTRILICADPSLFANQMLFYEDNARLALQVMNWLAEGNRTQLLILMDDQPIRPEDPQSVAVQLPPPTREQVWNALQQLPPELLLEFGNEIATLVEDENLVNELMSMALENVSDTHLVAQLDLSDHVSVGRFPVLPVYEQ